MEQIKFNLNEPVKVKLRIKGWSTLYKWHNRYSVTTEVELKKIYPVDKEGYTAFQLWTLMQIFGTEFYMGNDDHPFEMNIVIMKDSR